MSFLIVGGLFLSYGTLYDHLIDREAENTGLGYMLIHIFLIFAMNNITTSLEFVQNEEVSLIPKITMLILSLILYYVSLFLLLRYSKTKCKLNVPSLLTMTVTAVSFVLLMLLFRANMYVNIALTVVYVFAVFGLLHLFSRKAA